MKKLFTSVFAAALALTAFAGANGPQVASVYPEEGTVDVSTTGGISVINVTFDEEVSVIRNGEHAVFVNTSNNVSYDVVTSSFAWDPQLILFQIQNNDEYITAPGVYELRVPRGVVMRAQGVGTENEAFTLSWTIDGEVATSLVPEQVNPLGTVESFNSFTATFSEPITVAEGAVATIANGRGVDDSVAILLDGDRKVKLDITKTYTEEGDYTITFPAGAITGKSGMTNDELVYVVTIGSLELKIVSIDPSNAEPIIGFPEGSKINVTLNRGVETGYLEGYMEDLDALVADDAYVATCFFTKNDDNSFTWTNMAWDYKFYKDHHYRLTLSAYDQEQFPRELIGKCDVVYEGSLDVRGASEIQVLNVNPAPGSEIAIGSSDITVTFSGPVDFISGTATEGGQMAQTADVIGAANDDNTVWTLTVADTFLSNIASEITFILNFFDEEGNYILVGEGDPHMYPYYNVEDETYGMAITYQCFEAAVAVDVDPAPGKVDRLYDFKFTNPSAKSLNEVRWGGLAPSLVELYNAETNEVVARGASAFPDAATSDGKFVVLTLDKEITENGEYYLVLPFGAMTLGTEFTADVFKPQTLAYVIDNEEQGGVSEIENADVPVDVYTASGICVMRGALKADILNLPKGLYIAGGKKVIVL